MMSGEQVLPGLLRDTLFDGRVEPEGDRWGTQERTRNHRARTFWG